LLVRPSRGRALASWIQTLRFKFADKRRLADGLCQEDPPRTPRDFLLSGDPSVRVTDVALQCNFSNMGHFSKDFHDAFGERPSEMLSRSRKLWSFRQTMVKSAASR